jgi:hypothetical protein
MSKKLLMGLAPLLAVAAFAIVPAAASAVTTYGTCGTVGGASANCPGTEHFTPFAGEKRVAVFGKKVSGLFVLENEAKTADIECSEFTAGGLDWNKAGIGHSHTVLAFEGCKGSGTLAAVCPAGVINGNGIIQGDVNDEVKNFNHVDIAIVDGFEVVCGTTNLGSVTGAVTCEQPEKSAVLKCVKAAGLKFAGENATITGESEFLTSLAPNKKVFI